MTDQSLFEAFPGDADFNPITWDDSYAIALALRREHPHVDLEQVSLGMIYRWTLALCEFTDDPQLANEEILSSIYQEWFEEVISL
jgi:FeS assembly protein IscX